MQNQSRILRGTVLWTDIAMTQNRIIAEHGKIERNNKELWGDFLHKMDNQDWIAILTAVSQVQELEPQLFKPTQERAFAEVARTLVKHNALHYRVLDTKEYKADAWRALMCLREVWNAINEPVKPELFVNE